MADIEYTYSEGKINVAGTVLQDVRIGAYLYEQGLRRERKKYWIGSFTEDQVTNLLLWFASRGWTVKSKLKSVLSKTVKPKVTPKPKVNKATYYYGKTDGEPMAQLRGGGLKLPEAKALLRKYGFHWVFRKGRRNVKAYVAYITPQRLIEVLIHLKMLGLKINPSTKLKPRRWLYLDLPKTFEKQIIKSGDTIPYDDLIVWLEENGYSRLNQIEQPGDYSIKGDVCHIWTKQEDTLIRVVFDGEMVESIAELDPETLKAKFVSETTINGLKETGSCEPPILPPVLPLSVELPPIRLPQSKKLTDAEARELYPDLAAAWMCKVFAEGLQVERPKPKYEADRVQSIFKSFTQLDETHPFFNMVKWNK